MHNPTPSTLLNPNVGQSLFFSSFGARGPTGTSGMNGADAAIQSQTFGGRSGYNTLPFTLFLDQTAEDALTQLEEINSEQDDIKGFLVLILMELMKLNETTLQRN